MFVTEEAALPLPYEAARKRLLEYLRADGLQASSTDGFEAGRELLVRAGVGAVSKEVLVQLLQPYEQGQATVVPLRWVATGAAGTMFPQLDGNLELAPEGEEASTLTLAGAYRAPLAAVGATMDRVLLNRVAGASIRRFLNEVADDLADEASQPAATAHADR
jgi:hypothetical protein